MPHFVRTGCCFALIALLSSIALAREPGAHVHGIAVLQIAVDGSTVSLSLESPLENLLGFEHAPRNDAEQVAVRALRERLNKPETLFVPTPAARCAATSVKLASPVFEAQPMNSVHADLDAEFTFTCERPEALRDLEVRLFDGFPATRHIDVQVVAPRGQSAARLDAGRRRISW
jgi:Protein of unknown function (DUF2796)